MQKTQMSDLLSFPVDECSGKHSITIINRHECFQFTMIWTVSFANYDICRQAQFATICNVLFQRKLEIRFFLKLSNHQFTVSLLNICSVFNSIGAVSVKVQQAVSDAWSMELKYIWNYDNYFSKSWNDNYVDQCRK